MKISNEELSKIYDLYYKMLFNIAYSYTFNSLDSEEIVQEVFIKYYNRQYDDNELKNKNWLIRVTINNSISFLRKRKREEKILEKIASKLDETDSKEKIDSILIRKCIEKLDDKSKNIIILYYYDNLNSNEISNVLKISISNVTTRLNRAREKLKKYLKEEGMNI